MATDAVKDLAYRVSGGIRTNGHLQDVDDPAQAQQHSLFRGAYAEADRKTRKGFIKALNAKVRAEKRKEFTDDFGPIAALMSWQNRTPTQKVLEVLDEIIGAGSTSKGEE